MPLTAYMPNVMRHLTVLLLLAGLLASAAVPAADPVRIFVLHSYHQDYPWTARQHRGFVEALESTFDGETVIETEHLDTKRRAYEPEYADAFQEYLKFKYAGFSPDVVYVSDDNALMFALNHLEKVFPKTPVFFSGVNDVTAVQRISGRPVTGVFEKKEIAPNLALLTGMGRGTQRIIVLGDNSTTYQAIEREVREELQRLPEIEATFIADEHIDTILLQLQGLPDADLFLTTLGGVKNSLDQTLPLRETLKRIVGDGARVIISMEDVYLVDGVLGGYVTSGIRQGEAAAGLLAHFLNTGEIQTPLTHSPNEFLLDARAMARHQLVVPSSIRRLATLLHEPPSFYQRYRVPILSALIVVSALFTLSLVVFLVVLSRKNRQIEQRSNAFAEQAEAASRVRDSLNEAQRLGRQGSWEWDRAQGVFTCSEGLLFLCNTTRALAGERVDDFLQHLPGSDRVAFMAAIEKVCRHSEPIELVHRLSREDGSILTVREAIRLHTGRNGDTLELIGIVHDITERHVAETRLRESEEKYRRLFELSEDPMWLIVGSHFLMANQAAANILGYGSVEALTRLHPSALSPETQADGQASRDKAERMMSIAYREGYHRFEWTHRKQDGSLFPVEVSLTKIPYEGGDALFCIWRDTTEINAAYRSLEDKTAYLDGILSSSEKVAIIATDAHGRIRYYSPSAEKLFNLPTDRALGTTLMDLHRHREVSEQRYMQGLEQARESGEFRFTMQLETNGQQRQVDGRISPIHKHNDEFAGYMLMCEDVTEQRRATELIEYQATYDTLTELPNRRLFMQQLHQALARARRHQHLSAVLFIDLDNFKTINDSLGHPIGDTLLRDVANRIRENVREEDTVARLGGDEFVILAAELASSRDEAVSDAQALAEKVRQTLALPYPVDAHELHVTPSIGIAVFPSADESADDILRQADTAMYQAKESGRNAVRFFLPSMQRAAENRMGTISHLRHALSRNELQLYYQPQFNAARELCGAEALLRWQHPERGTVMPDQFIHLAEESGMILAIGDWVMREALSQFKRWREYAPDTLHGRVAVNVSALQFRQADFVTRVKQALVDSAADPAWLTLEMTESILLQDVDGTIEKIQTLKVLGVRFSIDDFGTGYSSLAYLKRLPVDEIKIDRSFVRDILTDANDAALVDTILTMAGHIGLEAVAEGVESEEAFAFLSERGCPVFQGYHFGRPCSADSFREQFLPPLHKAAGAKAY